MQGGDRTLTEFLSVFKDFTGKGAGEVGENGVWGKGALASEVLGYLMDGVIRDTKEDYLGGLGGLFHGAGLNVGSDAPGGGGDFLGTSSSDGVDGVASLSGEDTDGGADFAGAND